MASLSWEIVDGLFNVVEKEEMVREHCSFNLDVSVERRQKEVEGTATPPPAVTRSRPKETYTQFM